MLEKMPSEYKGLSTKQTLYTKSQPRVWTNEEVEWIKTKKEQGYSIEEIANSVGRTPVSVRIKLKRLSKEEDTYNSKWRNEKYFYNNSFLGEIKPTSILDLFCGNANNYQGYNVITNDIDKTISANYHEDAFKLLCKMNYENRKFDYIDLDPFGSAYDCFDLAIKIVNKGIAITFGEYGQKRFNRIDYVSRFYNINSKEEFTIDKMIDEVKHIAHKNHKIAIPYAICEWTNIARVWFIIEEEPKQKTQIKE